jgi:hypothetical protein
MTTIEPATIAEKLLYTTARIICSKSAHQKSGTAFFYNFPTTTDEVVPVLITNKHVVENTTKTEFIFHTFDGSEKSPSGRFSVTIGGNPWFGHPSPDIDLCALPLAIIQKAIDRKPFYIALDRVTADEDLKKLDAVEEILMIGYPNGLWDSVNNYPLIRRGITASHPGVDFLLEGKGPAVTVIDMACFPGSSGSPVFVYNAGTYSDKAGNTSIGSRAIFIGVLFSGPVLHQDGTITIKDIPTAATPVAEMQLMINLGYILKPREILVLGRALFESRQLSWPSSNSK